MQKTKYLYSLLFIILATVPLVGWHYFAEMQSEEAEDHLQASLTTVEAPEVYPFSIGAGQTLSAALRELGVESSVIHDIVTTAAPVKNLGRLQVGTRFLVYWSSRGADPIFDGIKFEFSPVERLVIRRAGEAWTVEELREKIETHVVTFSGLVNSSLWESAAQAQMDPALIAELAEIFSWQVDFAREVQSQDKWRLSVEQQLVNGKPFGWGSILAAEYQSKDRLYQAALFEKDGIRGYFAPDGSSLRRMFLKSPIKFGRISSRFQKARFHPVLRESRPHLGVDYAAVQGTPARTVGDGVITFIGWSGGGGNVVKIRHNSTYSTAYKHLSGFAKGLRAGSRVNQGQTIGFVGSTGLSTGPHLHFEFFQNGRYVDPLGRSFPSADPVPNQWLSEFRLEATDLLSALPSWQHSSEINRQTASAVDETTLKN